MDMPPDIAPVLEDLNPWWKEPGARGARAWPVRRSAHARLLEQLVRPDERRAQVLLGPRQVGKTTLLRQLVDDLLDRGFPARNLTYFDFEDFRLKRRVEPEEIGHLRPAGTDPDRPWVLLLDELHHVPRWDRWLKHAVDNGLGRIVATDSAASLLREGGRESGLGRWDEVVLEGLTAQEFAALSGSSVAGARGVRRSAVDSRPDLAGDPELIERYLALGGFPAYATSDNPQLVRERLRSDIVDRALRRDLAGHVDDPERLRKLFVYLVQESGAEQNYSARADDLGDTNWRTVAKWIELLQETFLIVPLLRGTTSGKASARLRGRSKLYAGDHGLVAAFAETHPLESEVRGKVFEAVVHRHLREVVRSAPAGAAELHYLRWRDGLEVDFLLSAGSERFAIEVTHSVQPKADKRKTVERAADRAGADRAVLIHGGLAEGTVDGVDFVPLPRFLSDPWAAVGAEGPGGTA